MKKNFILTTLFAFSFINYNLISGEILHDQNAVQNPTLPISEIHEVTPQVPDVTEVNNSDKATEKAINSTDTDITNSTENTEKLKNDKQVTEPEKTFEFTRENLFNTLWQDFSAEKLELLHRCNANDPRMSYAIPTSYAKFNALNNFVSKKIIETLESLSEFDRNKVTGVEQKQKNTSIENWNTRLNSAFKKFTESLDCNMFQVHFDQSDATSFGRELKNKTMILKTTYTLKRVSPSKKFQFYSESHYDTTTKNCSTPVIEMRCVFAEKKPIEQPKKNMRRNHK